MATWKPPRITAVFSEEYVFQLWKVHILFGLDPTFVNGIEKSY